MATNTQKNGWIQKLLNTVAAAKKTVADTAKGAAETLGAYKSAYESDRKKNQLLKGYAEKKAQEHAADMKPGLAKSVAEWADSNSMYTNLKRGNYGAVRNYNARVSKK